MCEVWQRSPSKGAQKSCCLPYILISSHCPALESDLLPLLKASRSLTNPKKTRLQEHRLQVQRFPDGIQPPAKKNKTRHKVLSTWVQADMAVIGRELIFRGSVRRIPGRRGPCFCMRHISQFTEGCSRQLPEANSLQAHRHLKPTKRTCAASHLSRRLLPQHHRHLLQGGL